MLYNYNLKPIVFTVTVIGFSFLFYSRKKKKNGKKYFFFFCELTHIQFCVFFQAEAVLKSLRAVVHTVDIELLPVSLSSSLLQTSNP